MDVLFASRHRPDPSADASTQQSQFAIDIRPIGAKWIWAYHANWLWASLAKWIWAVGAIEPQQQSASGWYPGLTTIGVLDSAARCPGVR